MLPFVNPAPIILTIATMLGVLVHDIHIDQTTAIVAGSALAAAAISADAADKSMSGNAHTHVERPTLPRSFTSLRSSLPNTQPPRDDDRRYIQNRKASLGFGDDQGYMWPSS